jgi:hypothetical protein
VSGQLYIFIFSFLLLVALWISNQTYDFVFENFNLIVEAYYKEILHP